MTLALVPSPAEVQTSPEFFTCLVTRKELLNFEHNGDPDAPFFCDWITMYQDHKGPLPIVSAGIVSATDENGELSWQTIRTRKIEGSHDTSVQVRCDGNTVRFTGNVSRFGRTDNVWGYGFFTCLRIINDILASVGLPPFTAGERGEVITKTDKGKDTRPIWTGARITRLDLTANYETGSMSNARAYMEWLSTQQGAARIQVGTFADGETVDWGRGSKYVYAKIYLKSVELKKHHAPENITQHCENTGLIRFELTAKSRWLTQNNLNYLGAFDMATLITLFKDRAKVLTRAEHQHDELENLESRALRCTARDWLAGDDLLKRMAPSTFRRHRAELLKYGIDIAVKRNVAEFKPRVRVIEIQPAQIPHWYQFHQPQKVA